MERGSKSIWGAGNSLRSGRLHSWLSRFVTMSPLSPGSCGSSQVPCAGPDVGGESAEAALWGPGLWARPGYWTPSLVLNPMSLHLGEGIGLYNYLHPKGLIHVSTCPFPLIFKVKRNKLVI